MNPLIIFGGLIILFNTLTGKSRNTQKLTGYAAVLQWKDIAAKWRDSISPDIPIAHILAIIAQESMGNPDAKGAAGEIGLMQITYSAYVDSGSPYKYESLTDPDRNIEAGIKYLKYIETFLTNNDVPVEWRLEYTIMAYNIGIGNVLKGKKFEAGKSYLQSVLAHRKRLINMWS